MAHYRLSTHARAELREIWVYVAENSSIESARQLSRQIYERFPLLADQPYLGHARPELASEVRSFPVSSYIILYRPTEYGVEILHIVHGRRRLEALFEQ